MIKFANKYWAEKTFLNDKPSNQNVPMKKEILNLFNIL